MPWRPRQVLLSRCLYSSHNDNKQSTNFRQLRSTKEKVRHDDELDKCLGWGRWSHFQLDGQTRPLRKPRSGCELNEEKQPATRKRMPGRGTSSKSCRIFLGEECGSAPDEETLFLLMQWWHSPSPWEGHGLTTPCVDLGESYCLWGSATKFQNHC